MKLLDTQMTPAEVKEMEEIRRKVNGLDRDSFEQGWRMGHIQGMLSCIAQISNNTTLFNDEPPRSEGQPPTGSKERVAPEGQEGDTSGVHGDGEDKAGD